MLYTYYVMNFLERMRTKPQHVKGQYAFLGALLFTAVVGSIWVASLPARFAEVTQQAEEPRVSSTDSKNSLGALFGSARDQLGAVVDSVTSARDSEGSPIVLEEQEMRQNNGSFEDMNLADFQPESNQEEFSSTTTSSETEGNLEEDTPVAEEKPQPRVILIGTTTRNVE